MPRIAAAVTVVIVMGMCIGFNTTRYPAVWKMVAESHQPPRPEQPALKLQSSTFPGPEPAVGTALIPDSTGASFTSASVDPIPFPMVLGRGDDEWSDRTSASEESVAASTPGDPIRSFASEDADDVVYQPPAELADSYQSASLRPRESGYDEQETGPVEVSPSTKYASGAADPIAPDRSTLEDRFAAVKRQPLVPVESADRDRHHGTTAGGDSSAEFGGRSRQTGEFDQRVQRLPPLDQTWEPPWATQESTSTDGTVPIYASTGDY